MNCKLCQRQAKLVASHIIPEFLYKTLYDSKHRFQQVSADPAVSNQYKQKGFREPLLCEDCEQRLSVSEQYMSKLLNGGVPTIVSLDGRRIRFRDIDYNKLKLFQISILWRAGVSSLPVFSQVQLGPHEPRLRHDLLTDGS